MGKPASTQWDFGELFPPEATRRVLTVSELTGQVRRLLESQIGSVWVSGEVSNLRLQPSGHAYFTLKDAGAQLACVLFRGEAAAGRALLQDGRKVLLRGEVTVYEPRGQYQLRVTAVEAQGVGALQAAFEKLKQKLQAEGLFASERKRPLPPYPERIGIVTSLAGAALRDVLHVIERRYAGLQLVLAPCRVQGEGAAAEIARAIRLLNEFSAAAQPARAALDAILVTRGGGSLEDLWAFNEEVVARAIFESALPVISAVGHEVDFTIADFVADVRAATPSAAAEILTAGYVASRAFVAEARERLREAMRERRADALDEIASLRDRLARAHPRRRLEERGQRLDDLMAALMRAGRLGLRERQGAWQTAGQRLARVRLSQVLSRRRESLARAIARLRELVRRRRDSLGQRWQSAEARLRLLGPEQVLARGYSITLDAASGKVIRSAAEVRAGQRLRTRLKSGEVRSVAEA
jgi:exodeoxyribonuclease VII large subunit